MLGLATRQLLIELQASSYLLKLRPAIQGDHVSVVGCT